jgi:hypothetical protein
MCTVEQTEHNWLMTHEVGGRQLQDVLGQNLATSNANVVVRNVAHLGVAGKHV